MIKMMMIKLLLLLNNYNENALDKNSMIQKIALILLGKTVRRLKV
jgi:hypothetical protein